MAARSKRLAPLPSDGPSVTPGGSDASKTPMAGNALPQLSGDTITSSNKDGWTRSRFLSAPEPFEPAVPVLHKATPPPKSTASTAGATTSNPSPPVATTETQRAGNPFLPQGLLHHFWNHIESVTGLTYDELQRLKVAASADVQDTSTAAVSPSITEFGNVDETSVARSVDNPLGNTRSGVPLKTVLQHSKSDDPFDFVDRHVVRHGLTSSKSSGGFGGANKKRGKNDSSSDSDNEAEGGAAKLKLDSYQRRLRQGGAAEGGEASSGVTGSAAAAGASGAMAAPSSWCPTESVLEAQRLVDDYLEVIKVLRQENVSRKQVTGYYEQLKQPKPLSMSALGEPIAQKAFGRTTTQGKTQQQERHDQLLRSKAKARGATEGAGEGSSGAMTPTDPNFLNPFRPPSPPTDFNAYAVSHTGIGASNAKQRMDNAYVDKQRYAALRQQEQVTRVTPERLMGLFEMLDFSGSGLTSLGGYCVEDTSATPAKAGNSGTLKSSSMTASGTKSAKSSTGMKSAYAEATGSGATVKHEMLSSYFPKLVVLNVSNNPLTTFDVCADLPPSVETLLMSNCQLRTIEFPPLPVEKAPTDAGTTTSSSLARPATGLRKTMIGTLATSLTHLIVLSVSCNQLTSLSFLASPYLTQLRILDASYNGIDQLEETVMDVQQKAAGVLEEVHLKGNPICLLGNYRRLFYAAQTPVAPPVPTAPTPAAATTGAAGSINGTAAGSGAAAMAASRRLTAVVISPTPSAKSPMPQGGPTPGAATNATTSTSMAHLPVFVLDGLPPTPAELQAWSKLPPSHFDPNAPVTTSSATTPVNPPSAAQTKLRVVIHEMRGFASLTPIVAAPVATEDASLAAAGGKKGAAPKGAPAAAGDKSAPKKAGAKGDEANGGAAGAAPTGPVTTVTKKFVYSLKGSISGVDVNIDDLEALGISEPVVVEAPVKAAGGKAAPAPAAKKGAAPVAPDLSISQHTVPGIPAWAVAPPGTPGAIPLKVYQEKDIILQNEGSATWRATMENFIAPQILTVYRSEVTTTTVTLPGAVDSAPAAVTAPAAGKAGAANPAPVAPASAPANTKVTSTPQQVVGYFCLEAPGALYQRLHEPLTSSTASTATAATGAGAPTGNAPAPTGGNTAVTMNVPPTPPSGVVAETFIVRFAPSAGFIHQCRDGLRKLKEQEAKLVQVDAELEKQQQAELAALKLATAGDAAAAAPAVAPGKKPPGPGAKGGPVAKGGNPQTTLSAAAAAAQDEAAARKEERRLEIEEVRQRIVREEKYIQRLHAPTGTDVTSMTGVVSIVRPGLDVVEEPPAVNPLVAAEAAAAAKGADKKKK